MVLRRHQRSPSQVLRSRISLLLCVVLALVATGCASTAEVADGELAAVDTEDSTVPAPTPSSTAPTDFENDPELDQADENDAATGVDVVDDTPTPQPSSPTPTPTPTPTPPPASNREERAASPDGRIAPLVASSPEGLAQQILDAENGLADPASTPQQRADFGHLHQVAIRKLGYEPSWDTAVFEALPPDISERTLFHVSARRALIDLSSGYDAADFIPAWEIVAPEPAPNLVSYYQNASEATGIEWEYLAAINLVETGMGRIRGLSSAGAQGPMQFLPTTWAEAGIGDGDINDPEDAIAAAARYLVRRGGPSDMPGAIWGYNNSDNYVAAVTAYAELLRRHPDAYEAIYHWEIYFFTEQGDVWLPAGMRYEESIDLDEFLVANPWSAPDPGLR